MRGQDSPPKWICYKIICTGTDSFKANSQKWASQTQLDFSVSFNQQQKKEDNPCLISPVSLQNLLFAWTPFTLVLIPYHYKLQTVFENPSALQYSTGSHRFIRPTGRVTLFYGGGVVHGPVVQSNRVGGFSGQRTLEGRVGWWGVAVGEGGSSTQSSSPSLCPFTRPNSQRCSRGVFCLGVWGLSRMITCSSSLA